jgi:hypothetical protein
MHPIATVLIFSIIVVIIITILENYYVQWNAKRLVDKIVSQKEKINPRVLEDPKYGRIICDNVSLSVKRDEQEVRMEWAWIEEIYAYKMDLFTTDMICLSLISTTGKLALEIHEEMAGYHDMQAYLERMLPRYSASDWFSDIAFPAFAENRKLIWKRKTEPNQSLQTTIIAVTDSAAQTPRQL